LRRMLHSLHLHRSDSKSSCASVRPAISVVIMLYRADSNWGKSIVAGASSDNGLWAMLDLPSGFLSHPYICRSKVVSLASARSACAIAVDCAAERQVSGAANSGSEARGDAVCGRLQTWRWAPELARGSALVPSPRRPPPTS